MSLAETGRAYGLEKRTQFPSSGGYISSGESSVSSPTNVETSETTFSIGSLGEREDRARAIDHIRNGGILAMQLGPVFGIWGDPRQESFRTLTETAKGEVGKNKTYSTMLETEQLYRIADYERIHPTLRHLFSRPTDDEHLKQQAESFRRRFGLVAFARVPIDPRAALDMGIPPVIMGDPNANPSVHHLDAFGHGPMSSFLREAKAAGIPFIAVTSMNDSGIGEKEIVYQERAEKFCQEKGISLLLTDPFNDAHESRQREGGESSSGSYGIFDVETGQIFRQGPEEEHVLSALAGAPLREVETTIPRKYLPFNFSSLNDLHLSPELLREAVLLAKKGWAIDAVKERMHKRQVNRVAHIEKANTIFRRGAITTTPSSDAA